MWVIRAYNPDDDELVAEHELPGARATNLTTVLRFTPTQFASVPLDENHVERVAKVFGVPVVKGAEYFLDFDGDTGQASSVQEAEEAAFA